VLTLPRKGLSQPGIICEARLNEEGPVLYDILQVQGSRFVILHPLIASSSPDRGMISYHTRVGMPKTKLAVTLDADLVGELDHLVAERQFPNRSQAIEAAVAEKIKRLSKTRLARECAKLDPKAERALAEEGLAGSRDTWPEY